MIRAAAFQLAPDLDEGASTVRRMVEAIQSAAADGVQLGVFPESLVPYYPYFSFVEPPFQSGREHLRLYEEAPTIPGTLLAPLFEAAAEFRMVLCIGVNERDGGTLYNTQILIDSDGTLRLRRRKITPSFHERMIWGRGDGSGLRAVNTSAGRIGALACWEHYNPLARYALMADREEIHCSQFPGSMVGEIFARQIEATIRHHALESGCFVVNATGWLTAAQRARITADPAQQKALTGGCFTAIVAPDGSLLGDPLTEGEGMVVGDLDFTQITKRKRMLDSVGHYSRPDLFTVQLHNEPQPAIVPDHSFDS